MKQFFVIRFLVIPLYDRLEVGKKLPPGIYFVKVRGYKLVKIIKIGVDKCE